MQLGTYAVTPIWEHVFDHLVRENGDAMLEAVSDALGNTEDRFAEILLYVAQEIEGDPTGGATKINKILYFADFAHQRAHGRSITDATYRRRERGPAPHRLLPVRNRLIADGDAHVRHDLYFGYRQDRLIANRRANTDVLTGSEKETLDQVIKALWGKTAAEVSELSHRDMAYQLVDDDDEIPYEYAHIVPSRMTPRLRERLHEIAENRDLLES